jgi:hypothetical protein
MPLTIIATVTLPASDLSNNLQIVTDVIDPQFQLFAAGPVENGFVRARLCISGMSPAGTNAAGVSVNGRSPDHQHVATLVDDATAFTAWVEAGRVRQCLRWLCRDHSREFVFRLVDDGSMVLWLLTPAAMLHYCEWARDAEMIRREA